MASNLNRFSGASCATSEEMNQLLWELQDQVNSLDPPISIEEGRFDKHYDTDVFNVDEDGRLTITGDIGGGGGGGTITSVSIILAMVDQTGGVRGDQESFQFQSATALSGGAPGGGSGTAVNALGMDFYDNEPFTAVESSDGQWIVLTKAWLGGLLMRTTSTVGAAVSVGTPAQLTLGSGTAQMLVPVVSNSSTLIATGPQIAVYNSVQQAVLSGRNVQVKQIGPRLVIDVAECVP